MIVLILRLMVQADDGSGGAWLSRATSATAVPRVGEFVELDPRDLAVGTVLVQSVTHRASHAVVVELAPWAVPPPLFDSSVAHLGRLGFVRERGVDGPRPGE